MGFGLAEMLAQQAAADASTRSSRAKQVLVVYEEGGVRQTHLVPKLQLGNKGLPTSIQECQSTCPNPYHRSPIDCPSKIALSFRT
jgi:hypothetical protein